MEPQLNWSAENTLKVDNKIRIERSFIFYVGTLSGTGLHFSNLV